MLIKIIELKQTVLPSGLEIQQVLRRVIHKIVIATKLMAQQVELSMKMIPSTSITTRNCVSLRMKSLSY